MALRRARSGQSCSLTCTTTTRAPRASCRTRRSCSTGASGRRPSAAVCSRATGAKRSTVHSTGALDFAGATAGAGFSHALDLFGDGSVRLVSTPGHSPGHVSVVLRTASGPLLLAGDAAYTRRAIAEGHDQIARADLAAYRNPSRASGDGPMPTPPHPSSAATTTSYGPICPRSTRDEAAARASLQDPRAKRRAEADAYSTRWMPAAQRRQRQPRAP